MTNQNPRAPQTSPEAQASIAALKCQAAGTGQMLVAIAMRSVSAV
jgi:hypothetical protein